MTSELNPRRIPSQDRSKDTVTWILEAATHVFNKRGYQAASTNQIAEKAGVSIGSVYQYFPNKESILFALLERHVQFTVERIDKHASRIKTDSGLNVEEIRSFVEFFLSLHREEPDFHQLVIEEIPFKQKDLIKLVKEAEIKVVKIMKDLIERTPQIKKDSDIAASIFVQTINNLTHRFSLFNDQSISAEIFIVELTEMLAKYLFYR